MSEEKKLIDDLMLFVEDCDLYSSQRTCCELKKFRIEREIKEKNIELKEINERLDKGKFAEN